jgi:hypothetical protein
MRRLGLMVCWAAFLGCEGDPKPAVLADAAPPDAAPADAAPLDAALADTALPDAALTDATQADAAPPPPPRLCAEDDVPATPWQDGPYGVLRHERADDFVVPVLPTSTLGDGEVAPTTFSLRDAWTGCESVIILPDTLRTSPLSPRSRASSTSSRCSTTFVRCVTGFWTRVGR